MGFEPRTPGRKANTIITELKRILPNAVVKFCIQILKQPCLKEWSPVRKSKISVFQTKDRGIRRQKVFFNPTLVLYFRNYESSKAITIARWPSASGAKNKN